MRRLFLLFTIATIFITNTNEEDLTQNQISLITVKCYHESNEYGHNRRILARLENVECDDCWTGLSYSGCPSNTHNLRVYSSSTHRVPKEIFHQFPSIQTFEMTNQNLSIVLAEDFDNAESLRRLNLTGNSIVHFPKTIFSNIPMIKMIDLSANNLEQFDLPSTYKSRLSRLYLNNNKLTSVPKSLSRFNQLSHLYLSDNYIHEFDFKHVPSSLVSLHLDNNNLTMIYEVEPFQLIDYVQPDRDDNDIEGDSDYNTNDDVGLKYLNLSGNSLPSISNLTNLHKLTELDVSENLLTDIDDKVFEKNTNLQKLILRGNLLKSFDFKNLHSLEYLDVSYNIFDSIPINYDLPELRELYLEGNNLTSINTNIKLRAPVLNTISIDNNNLECDRLRNDLMLLRMDKIQIAEPNNEIQVRTNFTSDENGIKCYKQNNVIEERFRKIEDQLEVLFKFMKSMQTTDSA